MEAAVATAGGGPCGTCCYSAWKRLTILGLVRFVVTSASCFAIIWGYLRLNNLDGVSNLCISSALSFTSGLVACQSRQLRCTLVLCIPGAFSKIGQRPIFVFITWTLLNVPVKHVVENLHSVSGTYQCFTTHLSETMVDIKNHVDEVYEDLHLSIQKKVDEINLYTDQIKENLNEGRRKIETVENYIQEGVNKVKPACEATSKKIRSGCTQIASWMDSSCKKVKEGLDPQNFFVIWSRSMCKKVNNGTCEDDFNLCERLSPNITYLSQKLALLSNQLKFKISSYKNATIQSNFKETAKNMASKAKSEFEFYHKWITQAFDVGHWIVVVLALALPLQSFLYLRQQRNKTQAVSMNFVWLQKMLLISSDKRNMKSFLIRILISATVTASLLGFENLVYAAMNVNLEVQNVIFQTEMMFAGELKTTSSTALKPIADLLGHNSSFFKKFTYKFNPSDCVATPVSPDNFITSVVLFTAYALLVLIEYFEKFGLKKCVFIVKWFYPDANIDSKQTNSTKLSTERSQTSGDIRKSIQTSFSAIFHDIICCYRQDKGMEPAEGELEESPAVSATGVRNSFISNWRDCACLICCPTATAATDPSSDAVSSASESEVSESVCGRKSYASSMLSQWSQSSPYASSSSSSWSSDLGSNRAMHLQLNTLSIGDGSNRVSLPDSLSSSNFQSDSFETASDLDWN